MNTLGLMFPLISCASTPLWTARIEHLMEDELDVVRLDNRFLAPKVAVNSEGRICSLVSKADGIVGSFITHFPLPRAG